MSFASAVYRGNFMIAQKFIFSAFLAGLLTSVYWKVASAAASSSVPLASSGAASAQIQKIPTYVHRNVYGDQLTSCGDGNPGYGNWDWDERCTLQTNSLCYLAVGSAPGGFSTNVGAGNWSDGRQYENHCVKTSDFALYVSGGVSQRDDYRTTFLATEMAARTTLTAADTAAPEALDRAGMRFLGNKLMDWWNATFRRQLDAVPRSRMGYTALQCSSIPEEALSLEYLNTYTGHNAKSKVNAETALGSNAATILLTNGVEEVVKQCLQQQPALLKRIHLVTQYCTLANEDERLRTTIVGGRAEERPMYYELCRKMSYNAEGDIASAQKYAQTPAMVPKIKPLEVERRKQDSLGLSGTFLIRTVVPFVVTSMMLL